MRLQLVLRGDWYPDSGKGGTDWEMHKVKIGILLLFLCALCVSVVNMSTAGLAAEQYTLDDAASFGPASAQLFIHVEVNPQKC